MASRTEFKWKGEVVEEGIKFTNEVDGKYYIWKTKGVISPNGFFVVDVAKFPRISFFTTKDMDRIRPFNDNYFHLINWGISKNNNLILRFKYRKECYFVNIYIEVESRGMKAKKDGHIGVKANL